MRPYKNYGKSIRRLRRYKEWSQEKLAEKSNLDPKTIISIELGKRNPTLKTLQKISNALNIPLSKLLEE